MKITKCIKADNSRWFHGPIQADLLVCPVCGFIYTHIDESPTLIDSGNQYKAWKGQGNLIIIPIYCECGTYWEFCFGHDCGQTYLFSRILESCR